MKFLIDECLSPSLARVAHRAGFEAYHVAHRGWGGHSDHEILKRVVDEELVFVTNNRDDFLALVNGVEIHPGLVVIVDNVRRSEQLALFAIALQVARAMSSLINKVVEVKADGTISVYDLPA